MDPIRLLRQHWRPAAVAALLMLATVAWYAWPSSSSAAEAILTAPVKSGEFKVLVTTTKKDMNLLYINETVVMNYSSKKHTKTTTFHCHKIIKTFQN
jgi:hypothetical protein